MGDHHQPNDKKDRRADRDNPQGFEGTGPLESPIEHAMSAVPLPIL